MHHKLFDRGAFSLSGEQRVVNPEYGPREGYLAWHRREVFRGVGRP